MKERTIKKISIYILVLSMVTTGLVFGNVDGEEVVQGESDKVVEQMDEAAPVLVEKDKEEIAPYALNNDSDRRIYNEGDYVEGEEVTSGDWKLKKVEIYHDDNFQKMVRLEKYIGSSNDVKVPTAFFIDGEWIRTTVNMDISVKKVEDSRNPGNTIWVNKLFDDSRRESITSVDFKVPDGYNGKKMFVNKSMANMFSCFTNLKSVTGLGNLDMVLADKITSMFRYCDNLETIDAKQLSLENVKDISHVFEGCKKIENLDVSGWDVKDVTNMDGAFSGCESAKVLNLSNWEPNSVETMNGTFYKCRNVKTLDVSDWNVSQLKDMDRVFGECNSLTSLGGSAANQDEYLAKWNTENVETMYQSFCGCRKLPQLNIADWNVEKVTTLAHTFDMGLDNGSAVNSFKGFAGADGNITNKLNWNTNSLTNLKGSFSVCSGLDKIQFGPGFDTSKVTTMNSTFSYCSGLTSLQGMEDWNTQKVTNMHGMFYGAKVPADASFNPKSNGIWDVSHVTDMGAMFGVSTFGFEVPLKSSVEKWNTSSLENTEDMFYACGYLGFDNQNMSFDLSNWTIDKVNNAKGMFKSCDNLKIINLGDKKFADNVQVDHMFDATAKTNTMIISKDPTLAKEFSEINNAKIANRIPYGPSYYVPEKFNDNGTPVWKNNADCNYFDKMVVSPSEVMQGNEVKLTKNQLENRYKAQKTIESDGKKYTFEGWYLDPDYNNKVDGLTPYYFREQRLYAKYTTEPVPPVTGLGDHGLDRDMGLGIAVIISASLAAAGLYAVRRKKYNR